MPDARRGYDGGKRSSSASCRSATVFAIAMTLLVVGIGVPRVAESRLHHALAELRPAIVSFFISFVVIGIIASLIPVFVFAISIPIALVSSSWALFSWLLTFPAERTLDRWKPAGVDELLH